MPDGAPQGQTGERRCRQRCCQNEAQSHLWTVSTGRERVIVHMRHTAELVFLDIGDYPDIEVNNRKNNREKLGQNDRGKKRAVTFMEIGR